MSLDDLTPQGLYHLATRGEWAEYQARGEVLPAAFADEGFVHCSYGHQVRGTVEKHFAGVTALLALHLDAGAFGDVRLVDEDLYGSGQAFPHAYGPIPVTAVVGTTQVA